MCVRIGYSESWNIDRETRVYFSQARVYFSHLSQWSFIRAWCAQSAKPLSQNLTARNPLFFPAAVWLIKRFRSYLPLVGKQFGLWTALPPVQPMLRSSEATLPHCRSRSSQWNARVQSLPGLCHPPKFNYRENLEKALDSQHPESQQTLVRVGEAVAAVGNTINILFRFNCFIKKIFL